MKINCLDSLHKNYKGPKEKCCGSIFFLCRTVAMETIFRSQLASIPVQHTQKKKSKCYFHWVSQWHQSNCQSLQGCRTLATAKHTLILLGAKLIRCYSTATDFVTPSLTNCAHSGNYDDNLLQTCKTRQISKTSICNLTKFY